MILYGKDPLIFAETRFSVMRLRLIHTNMNIKKTFGLRQMKEQQDKKCSQGKKKLKKKLPVNTPDFGTRNPASL